MATTTTPDAPLPKPPGLAPGWTDYGNNLVQNTANQQIVPTNHPIYQQALAGGSAPAPAGTTGAAPSPLGGTVTAGATTAPGAPTTAAGAFQQALVNRMTAPPPSASSPAIAPAIAANKLAEQRGMERSRAQLAERSAAEGTANSGGFDTALTGLNQDRAQREGQFAGNAVMQQATQQANELTQALTLYGNMYSDEQRLAMQEKLANLQAQLQRESLAQQGSLATQQLAQTGELGRGNLNLGLLSALLGNQVSNSSLGLQAGLGQANLNQNAVLSMLGYL